MPDRSTSLGPRAGACYWCGAPADSLEDIIPKWIDKALPLPVGIATGRPRLRTVINGAERTQSVQRFATKVGASKCVCARCNNRWMSGLERDIKPILEPLIRGHAGSLSVEVQLQVALWASMKAAVADARPRTGDGGLASESIRSAIYERRELPIDMLVRLAAFDEPFHVMLNTPHAVGTGQKGQYLAQWCTTFVFGHLVVQITGRTGSSKEGVLEQLPAGAHDGRSFTVWPPQPRPVDWPPRLVLDRDDLVRFTTEMLPGHPPLALFDKEGAPCGTCGDHHGIVTRHLPQLPSAGPADGLTWAPCDQEPAGGDEDPNKRP